MRLFTCTDAVAIGAIDSVVAKRLARGVSVSIVLGLLRGMDKVWYDRVYMRLFINRLRRQLVRVATN